MSFPEEKAALYAAERRQEIERSSVCVLLLKTSVSRLYSYHVIVDMNHMSLLNESVELYESILLF